MHDEATTSYIDMIDQTTLGHRFIFEEFGVRPTVTWQIDVRGVVFYRLTLLDKSARCSRSVIARRKLLSCHRLSRVSSRFSLPAWTIR
jgi:hypothetical protein